MKKIFLSLKRSIQPISRNKKQHQFYLLFKEDETVLDIGVHSEKSSKSPESANHFIKTFKYNPSNYTGLGIEDMSAVTNKYPKMNFVQYSGGTFPFKNNEFDWAYSNAVIEHVGDIAAKVDFINEMSRVCKNVFFTTPNKYFPIDAHTMVWFIHWKDSYFTKWRKKNNNWWPQARLNLVSLKEIKYLLKESNIKNYQIIKNRMLGLTMTFTVVINE